MDIRIPKRRPRMILVAPRGRAGHDKMMRVAQNAKTPTYCNVYCRYSSDVLHVSTAGIDGPAYRSGIAGDLGFCGMDLAEALAKST